MILHQWLGPLDNSTTNSKFPFILKPMKVLLGLVTLFINKNIGATSTRINFIYSDSFDISTFHNNDRWPGLPYAYFITL